MSEKKPLKIDTFGNYISLLLGTLGKNLNPPKFIKKQMLSSFAPPSLVRNTNRCP